MRILKLILVFFASLGLGTLLILLVWATAFRLYISDPDKVKYWVDSSGAYENFTEALLEQSAQQSAASDNSLPLEDPALIERAKQAFGSEYLQTTTESVLDGIFAWLRGETFEPKFVIDLSAPRQEFAALVSSYAAERYESLPDCDLDGLPASVDPFSDTCKVPGMNTERIARQIQDELSSSDSIFGQDKFTATSFQSPDNPNASVFDDLSFAPKVYMMLRVAPFAILALLVFCCLILLFLDTTKLRGLRKIGIALLVNGLLVLIFTFVSGLLLNQLDAKFGGDNEGTAVIEKVVNPLISTANKDTSRLTTGFGAAYIVLGLVILTSIYLYKRGQKNKDTEQFVPPANHHDDPQLPPDPIASATDTSQTPEISQPALRPLPARSAQRTNRSRPTRTLIQ